VDKLFTRQLLLWRSSVIALALIFLGFGSLDFADGAGISFVWLGVVPVIFMLLLLLTSGRAFLTFSDKYAAVNNARYVSGFVNGFEVVALAKTGTLVSDSASVVLVKVIAALSKAELVAFAAAVEVGSNHLIGNAVKKFALANSNLQLKAKDFREIPGVGVTAIVDGAAITVGGPGLLTSRNITLEVDDLILTNQENELGRTVVFVIRDSELLGMLSIEYQTSELGSDLVYQLRKLRKHVIIVSGDSHGVVKSLAGQLGIDKYLAEILPHNRDQTLEKLASEDQNVLFLKPGTGWALNDSVGRVTRLTADLATLFAALKRGAALSGLLRRNAYLAGVLSLLGLPLALGLFASAGAVLSFVLGAVLMSLSTIIVLANAQLLRK